MITKEMLLMSFGQGKFSLKQGKELKIVLSRKEVEQRLRSTVSDICFTIDEICFTIDEKSYYFYTDSYCVGQGITWGPNKRSLIDTVPSSTDIPHRVVERKGLEDGWVNNLDHYEFIYHYNDIRIETLEEYLDILNQHLN